ncbi:hypothetical protein LTR56_021641 [Elasticomyces elasticus]|nr:hypothetical protein LTR56_021641 [Elasticomyces elasticus]KAK3623509.1 hypothetical protein LTR22_024359 [Elasticomyces elasticus]KAK5759023.1 hypothetical protein LTS12_010795 [Elasticomyces elasticus]
MAKGNSYYNKVSMAVQRVNLPERAKCIRCKKVKSSSAFSENQQKELKAMILQQPKFNATDTGYASCSTCTPGCQRFEFECFGCDKVKARAKFSKVQLRNPDKALCWDCSKERCNIEPGGGSDVDSESDSGGGSSDDSSYDDDNEGASVAGTFSGMSISGTGSNSFQTSGGVAVPNSSGFTSHQSTVSPQASMSGAGPSTMTGRVTPPHLRAKAPSSVYAASETSFVTGAGAAGPSRRAPSSTMGDRDPTSGGGKFAKLRAVRPQGPDGPAPVVQTPKKTQTKVQKKSYADDDGDSICVSASDSD